MTVWNENSLSFLAFKTDNSSLPVYKTKQAFLHGEIPRKQLLQVQSVGLISQSGNKAEFYFDFVNLEN